MWSSYGRQRGRCQTAFPSLSWAFRPTRNILVASISVSFQRSLSLCSLAVMRRRHRRCPLSDCTPPPHHLNSARLSAVHCGSGCRTPAKAAVRRPLSQTVIYGNCRHHQIISLWFPTVERRFLLVYRSIPTFALLPHFYYRHLKKKNKEKSSF